MDIDIIDPSEEFERPRVKLVDTFPLVQIEYPNNTLNLLYSTEFQRLSYVTGIVVSRANNYLLPYLLAYHPKDNY